MSEPEPAIDEPVGRSLERMAEEQSVPRIAADLDALRVPTASLRPHPENARRGDVGALRESLLRFGQVRPILALPDGTVVAGNHLLRAAESLGWDEVAAVREDMPEEEARAYLVADNRLADLGTYDNDKLAGLLRQLGPGGVRGTGYQSTGLDAVLRRLAPAPPVSFKSVDPLEVDAPYRCPACGFEGDRDVFETGDDEE